MISATLADIAGGAQALSELDLARLVRRYRLPVPDRQAPRRDSAGRRRWLDAVWEAARVLVEVDGIHHLEAAEYWADMDRDMGFTLGGMKTNEKGQVLNGAGAAIPGLYAAGACASNLAYDSMGYSTGTCIGESTFFGRQCGIHAAAE